MVYAVVCSLSRVTDKKHHPTDVLAGAVLGIALAMGVSYVAGGTKYSNCDPDTETETRRGSEEIEFKVP